MRFSDNIIPTKFKHERIDFMKKILCLILTMTMLLTISVTAFAATDEQYKSLSEITTQELTNYALNFAKEFDNSLELNVGDIIPIYDSADKLVGYSIAYYISDIPYGYINLNFTYEDPVVEFVVHENARSLYQYLEDGVSTLYSACSVDKKLINISPLEYSISAIDGSNQRFYYNVNEGTMTVNEFNSLKEAALSVSPITYDFSGDTKYDSHADLFSSSYETGSTVITKATYTSKYSSSKSLISQYNIMTSTSKYACAVVALTEVANQEGILKNSSIADTFNALWTATSTTVESTKTFYGISVSLGSTYDSKLSTGMTSYSKDRGKTCTTTTKNDPAFSFFTGAMDSNYSATLSYRIYETSGDKTGHTVNVVGYCVASKSGTTSNYLIVADGWYNNAPKYMNYSSIDFVDTYGVQYVIK